MKKELSRRSGVQIAAGLMASAWAAVSCAGGRYLEQYGNHYIAFRLLAVLRDKIFTKLRPFAPPSWKAARRAAFSP